MSLDLKQFVYCDVHWNSSAFLLIILLGLPHRPDGNISAPFADMSLVLNVRCQDRLRVARWHPTNQNIVATVGGSSREVFVYNLETYRVRKSNFIHLLIRS